MLNIIFWATLVGASAFGQAIPQDGSHPGAIRQTAQGVVRILFLPPKQNLLEVPLKEYEETFEIYYPKETFVGEWFRRVGEKCRKEKKEKCPVMAELVWDKEELLVSLGSAFVAGGSPGESKTLYTAAHVWMGFHGRMSRLAASKQSEKEKRIQATDQIGTSADFILFDGAGKILFNTYEAGDRATIREYAVPELFYLLYPNNPQPAFNDNLEFIVFDLSRDLGLPPIEFAKVEADPKAGNGMAMKYGTTLYAIGFPGRGLSSDPVKIVKSTLDRGYISSIESSAGVPREWVELNERMTFTLADIVDLGMSGGPIVDEDGRIVSLNSAAKLIVTNPGPQFRRVTAGPHPLWFPGVGIKR
jgi:hypothetical protein